MFSASIQAKVRHPFGPTWTGVVGKQIGVFGDSGVRSSTATGSSFVLQSAQPEAQMSFRPIRAFLLISLFILPAPVAQGQPQQTPPRDPTASPTSTGAATIRGRVLAADTGRPLRRARITALAAELQGQPRNTSTDANGDYELSDLPAGRYTIRVTRGGYLTLTYGQRRPREAPKPVQLVDRQTLEHVDFALPKMSIISGRVLDETGDPIEGVNVYAARTMFRDGHRQLVLMGPPQNRTDDAGQYRILGLTPGSYCIVAITRETWTVTRNGMKEVLGYSPTYFPGTTQSGDARRVTLRVGEEAANTDFALVPGRAARVSGTAFDSHGKPFKSVVVHQETRGEDFGSFGTVVTASVNADGTFAASNVPPGDYVIGTSNGRDTPDPQVALMPLHVEGIDVDGISLIGSSGGVVSGRVLTEDGTVPDIPRLSVTVGERMIGQPSPILLGAFGPPFSEVSSDGTFSVKGVVGRARLTVRLPQNWAVKLVLQDGHDITDAPIELASGQSLADVQVIVTDKITTVSGQLVDEKGAPITEATVIVFANDSAKWNSGRFVQATRPDQQGRWQIKGLPGGDYLTVAVDYIEDGEWNDPEYLDSVRRFGRKLTLADAASEQVALRVSVPQ
jgi:protocatechuate 3,4-dioxygenase beta subunit